MCVFLPSCRPFPGTFLSTTRHTGTRTCPTWKTPACSTSPDSSTSFWLWWSPRATLTRNLSTTTVSPRGPESESSSSPTRQTVKSGFESFFFSPAVLFLCIVLILLAVMSWLVLSPSVVLCEILKLFNFQYMDFKLLLLALAALNFIVCFIVEVSDGATKVLFRTYEFHCIYF